MTLIYPSNQLDSPDTLASMLGTFWYDLYGGRDQVLAYVEGKCLLEQQTQNDLQNLAGIGGLRTTPLFRRLLWYPVRIRANDIVDNEDGTFTWTAPDKLVDVPVICSQLATPSVVLLNNLDFVVDRDAHTMSFIENPFTNPLFPINDILADDLSVEDQEIELWLFQADFEENYLSDHYGYVINLKDASTEGYKRALIALWDALVSGTAREQIDAVLTACTGAETAKQDGEVVQYISSDAVGKLVITDQNVYRYHADATILVSVGEILVYGQYLADTFIVYDTNRGQVPPWDVLNLSKQFFVPAVTEDLTFQNEDLATTYIADDGFGYAELRFPVLGTAAVVDAFFDELQSRGRDADETLAMLLDERETPVGQPGASNLPATINPMEFVVQNVLRYGTLFVTIQGDQFAPDAFGLAWLSTMLRRTVPPWCTVLGLLKLTAGEESATLTVASDSFESVADV